MLSNLLNRALDAANEMDGDEPILEIPRSKPWVGFDLDGTLAEYTTWKGVGHIGAPVPAMVARLRKHLAQGDGVKILTARAKDPAAITPITTWLKALGLPALPITAEKDHAMTLFYDDRAVAVERNTGTVTGFAREMILESTKQSTSKQANPSTNQKAKYTLAGTYQFQGLPIAVENKAGSDRKGVDPDGHEWKTRMHFDYGYIRKTVGADNEGIDVYIGPDRKAPHVYIVKQHAIEKVKAWGGEHCPTCGEHAHDCACPEFYDEDKVMMGFPHKKAAREAYLKQYDNPLFLGPISTMTTESFRKLMGGGEGEIEIPLQFVM